MSEDTAEYHDSMIRHHMELVGPVADENVPFNDDQQFHFNIAMDHAEKLKAMWRS